MDLRLHPRPVRGDEGDRSMVGFGLARTRDQPRSISRLMARGRHDILLPFGSAVLELHAHEHAGARQQARIAGVRVELLGVNSCSPIATAALSSPLRVDMPPGQR